MRGLSRAMSSTKSNPFAGMKKPKKVAQAPPDGPMDSFCMHWMGIPASHALRIVALGLSAGAFMEAFMIKVWIGQTNCARAKVQRCVMVHTIACCALRSHATRPGLRSL